MKPTLEELAAKYDCDKAIARKDGSAGHGYTPHYEKFFEPLRTKPIRLLEIGIAAGPSIQMWLDYFINARIFGVDIVGNTNDWNTPGSSPNPRYQCAQGNQSDPTMWKCAMANFGVNSFDILIDDGSHMSGDIITAFECMWPNIVRGGLYCIEDLGVSYSPGTVFHTPKLPTHERWLSGIVDNVHQGIKDVESVYFSRELAIIRKA